MTLTTLRVSKTQSDVSFRQSGNGPVLVLIHGVGLQSAAWDPQITELGQDHHIIAVDMPGHGSSTRLAPPAELADYVDWMADFLVELDLGPVSLAGHSMGALIAGGIAATRPELVHRVALLNPVFNRSAEASRSVMDRAEKISNGQIDNSIALSRWFDASKDQQDAARMTADWLNAMDPKGYADAYSAFAKGDATFAHAYPNIACPFLALTGDGDPNSTPEMAHEIAALVPQGRSQIISGHRHMVNLTAPELVNQALRDWLNIPLFAKELI